MKVLIEYHYPLHAPVWMPAPHYMLQEAEVMIWGRRNHTTLRKDHWLHQPADGYMPFFLYHPQQAHTIIWYFTHHELFGAPTYRYRTRAHHAEPINLFSLG